MSDHVRSPRGRLEAIAETLAQLRRELAHKEAALVAASAERDHWRRQADLYAEALERVNAQVERYEAMNRALLAPRAVEDSASSLGYLARRLHVDWCRGGDDCTEERCPFLRDLRDVVAAELRRRRWTS